MSIQHDYNILNDKSVAQNMISPWEETFDWLSLKDLHSVAQLCQQMQHVAGYIFRENYPMEMAHFDEDKTFSTFQTRMSVDVFREYIKTVSVDAELTLNDCRNMGLIGEKQFKSLRCIELCYVTLFSDVLQAIKDKLGQIQNIKLKFCEIENGGGDLYEHLLKHAPKLKVLRVEVGFKSKTMIGIGNNWLRHQYPDLQHFDLRGVNAVHQIDELTTFFRQNPNIVKLELDDKLFRSNRRVLLEATIELNVLVLEFHELKPREFDATCVQLNELYGRSFYQKLHLELRIQQSDETFIHKIGTIRSIEKVFLWTSENSFDGNSWPAIKTLKELHLSMWIAYHPLQNMETCTTKLANLEHIIFDMVHPDTIYICMSKLHKLKFVKFLELDNADEENINDYISLWNETRKKLRANRLIKVTIYVKEKYYLAAKWALKANLSHIEVRRMDIVNYPFSDYGTI